MAESWIIKYEPKSEAEVIGQEKALEQLNLFIQNYKMQKKKAAFLYGPSGCGKTILVKALAKKHNLELIEVNASDYRTKEQIEEKVGNAIKQYSLFGTGKLILIDEIDGLSGVKDRGALTTIAELMQSSKFPIVCTASDPYDQKFSSFRSKTLLIECSPPSADAIFKTLKSICEKEKISYDEIALKGLARRCGGDVRATINDLQGLASQGKITKEVLEELSERTQLESMPRALVKVFKNSDPVIALSAFDQVNEDTDQIFLWMSENLPKEYADKDLARAYEQLSRADVFRGRITRWQHWRFLSYINAFLTAGIATAKDKKNAAFVKYVPTMRLLKIWQANMKYQKRKSIAGKVAQKTHASLHESIQSTVPLLKSLFKTSPQKTKQLITAEFDLDDDEVGWLEK
ncbi:replication factor C large subunit [Candidatus Woesearchaeota archaeon]|nr:replication factor C large subunit [Candidatus Woesearchaeota archaeon]